MSSNVFAPGPSDDQLRAPDGSLQRVPTDWSLLPPGDPGLTRRVKAAGEHWVVQEKKGKRTFSRGVFAPHETIERLRNELAAERSTEAYAKRQRASAQRREKLQSAYVSDFTGAVLDFLAFHPIHHELAHRLAKAVTHHATPIGSGTVARTQRIPIESRAEAAVIAWMRHQTTAYDSMSIPRVRGKRREIRRQLAQRSQQLLERYRLGKPSSPSCPLHRALKSPDSSR